MPTGLKQWASDQGLPVSLEAAIRKYRAKYDTPENIETTVQFYKTNSAEKKQEFDAEFIDLLAEAKKDSYPKGYIESTIGSLVSDIVFYVAEGPDLPDTPIKAFNEYLNKDEAQKLTTYWSKLEPNDRNDLIGAYADILNDPWKEKAEKEQDIQNFIYAFDKKTKEYFMPPIKKLLRNVLSEYKLLVGPVEDFFDRGLDPQVQQKFNDAVLKTAQIQNDIQRTNQLIQIILELLKIYSVNTSDTGVDFVRSALLKRIQPLEGQQKSAAQLQEESKEESKSEAQELAAQNLLVAQLGAAQQDAGSDPSTLANPQGLFVSDLPAVAGENTRTPFMPLTNSDAVGLIRGLLRINNDGITIDPTLYVEYNKQLATLSTRTLKRYDDDTVQSPDQIQNTKYDIAAVLNTQINAVDGNTARYAPLIEKYAKKRGYDSTDDMIYRIKLKIAENPGLSEAYEGNTPATKNKSFKQRLNILNEENKRLLAKK